MVFDVNTVAAEHAVREIELPGWGGNDTVTVRVRRAQLYEMAREGFIPNPLKETISKMFFSPSKEVDRIPIEEQGKAVRQIAKYTLVEPTLEEIERTGLRMTDAQYERLYAYALMGALAIAPFRARKRGSAGTHGVDVPQPPEQLAET